MKRSYRPRAVDDLLHLFGEIGGYSRRSVKEAGALPWALAGVGGAAFGCLAALGLHWAASRAVSAPLVGSYWVTRILCSRFLAFVLCTAFSVAYFQNKALIGDNGILPARALLLRADGHVRQKIQTSNLDQPGFLSRLRRGIIRIETLPTLLWLSEDWHQLDVWLDRLALGGGFLSFTILLRGGATFWEWMLIWVVYHSINSIGQRFYGFGWEAQLLETVFLAALASPAGILDCWWPFGAFPTSAAPPLVAVWAFRWMVFRIMLGAGLIKLRGASCWLDLTAMCHHLETQPIPNPLTRFFHLQPRWLLLSLTASNHVIELWMVWLVLLPFSWAQAAFGATHVLFQVSLILTGNLSFLNWLTIVPGIYCFDDAMLVGLLPEFLAHPLAQRVLAANVPASAAVVWIGYFRSAVVFAFLAWLSVPVYYNLLGTRGGARQRMNSSFSRALAVPSDCRQLCRWVSSWCGCQGRTSRAEASQNDESDQAAKRRKLTTEDQDEAYLQLELQSLRLLNTYGAFGSVTKERVEIIFEGFDSESKAWLPYVFKAAVDDPHKRPTWFSPYHYRLDWCRWIASCRGRYANGLQEQWIISLVGKLLEGDEGVRKLLARPPLRGDPFEGRAPPEVVRARLFAYKFKTPPLRAEDPYWLREHVGDYLPQLTWGMIAPSLFQWGFIPSLFDDADDDYDSGTSYSPSQ